MARKNLGTGNLDGARPDKYQQLRHKASILQLNDETTGNTENRADHSSLFVLAVLANQFSMLSRFFFSQGDKQK